MKRLNTLLGLPPVCLNLLAGGFSSFLILIGVNIMNAPNLALKVANTQLITSSSVDKLENLTEDLGEQATVIKQKDEAYKQLENTYKQYINGEIGNVELEEAFDKVQNIPDVNHIEEIKAELSETEDKLLLINGD